MFLANSTQIRMTDEVMIRDYDFPGILLMETAGRKSAEDILEKYGDYDLFLILAGPGNNGGDGLVIARYLAAAGKNVRVVCSHVPENYSGDAGINWRHLKHLDIPVAQLKPGSVSTQFQGLPDNTLLIDALLGTGVKSELRGNILELVEYFRPLNMETVAIDLPSGLNADSGRPLSAPIAAIATYTFGLAKLCHFVTPAANFCGEVIVVEIGILPEVVNGLSIQRRLITGVYIGDHARNRASDSHKGTHGHAWLAGGSKSMAGAIALAANSTLKIGAGLCTALIPGSARCALYSESLEVMNRSAGPDDLEWLNAAALSVWQNSGVKTDALAIGPGLGKNADTLAFLRAMLQNWDGPLVLDADALNLLAENADLWDLLPENCILTPHPGEMARLTGSAEVQQNRLELAEELAQSRQVIVVLKGAGTIVALPNGNTWINTSGNAGMATAGAGDVLTGAITGLLAQGYSSEVAACMAVYLHGLAGDLHAEETGPEGVVAGGIAERLSQALRLAVEAEGMGPRSI